MFVLLKIKVQIIAACYHSPSNPRPHRGYASHHCQERGQAAQVAGKSSSDNHFISAEKASNKSKIEQYDLTEKSEVDNTTNTAEQDGGNFVWDSCDIESNLKNGLSVHMQKACNCIPEISGRS